MHRWHESGCRRPDVTAASGLPCCAYCFAIPSIDDYDILPEPPQLENRSRMNLEWPPIIKYSNWTSEDEEEGNRSDREDHMPELSPQESLLPELRFEDNIRLLRLKPGTADEPIHAEFDTVRIDQIPLPLYEALSYTSINESTDSFEPCPVYIGNYWDVVHVSMNCGKALRQLRRPEGDKPEEKNSQVHILREIYPKANKVIAYVGDEPSEFTAAFSFLREITAFDPKSRHDQVYLNEEARNALSKLLQQPHFSRLWALQETLMARELEIFCGDTSSRWPKRSFGGTGSGLEIPSWLLKDSKWFPFSGKDLLNVLIDASQYQCSDPRDKVFAVLGLMGGKFIKPDYRLSIESVYIGIGSYLVEDLHTLEIFALLGRKQRSYDLPSWIPDWSQSLSRPPFDIFTQSRNPGEPEDEILTGAVRIEFDSSRDNGRTIQVNSATGAMRLEGINMCKVSGEVTRFCDYTHVQLPSTPTGSFIVTIPHQNCELILRPGMTQDTYALVTPCVLLIACPDSKFLIDWYRRQRRQESHLKVSNLAPEDVHASFLSYLMIPHAVIRRIEIGLVGEWKKWNTELGWMFRDQSAVWQFLLEVNNQLSLDERTGEDRMSLRGPDYFSITQTGAEVSSLYTWDLTQFCWSFLQPTVATQSASELQWSPIVDHLRSHLEEIRKWAQLTRKWTSQYQKFLSIAKPNLEPETQQRPLLEPDHLWNVLEFESQMRARQDILALLKTPSNQAFDDGNIRSHALLTYLGLDLYNEQRVDIQ
ncbi:hypothetical protein BJX70DRAFT_388273 [Aspergillus crustosus]